MWENTWILNVHTDNSKIELKCKNCGIYEISINNYYDKLLNNNYFIKCFRCGINYKNYYFLDCKKGYCESCKNHLNHHNYIQLNKKKDYCLEHNKKFKLFCIDCEENLCGKELKNLHKGHEIVEINPKDKAYKEFSNFIETTNEELKEIIEFNNLVLNIGENFQNNYFLLRSIINLGKSYEEEKNRDSMDIKCFLSGLNKDIENLNKKGILYKKEICFLNIGNIFIYHKEMKLDDQDFKYISQIRFNQLKEIDISENNIKNIEPFNKMSLPFLEFLNLSHNEIQIIEPITNLKSKNLQYIFLQNNKIEDIESFLKYDFPVLKILRLEDNIIMEENEEKKKLIDRKYKGKFFYKSMKDEIKEFKNKYCINDISEYNEEIDISDRKGGDEMLKYLFLIITYKSKNKIK